MSIYSGKASIINRAPESTYDFFADLTRLKERFDALPEEQRQQLGEVNFEPDAITIVTPQVGPMRLEVVERDCPNKVVYAAANSPIAAKIIVNFAPFDGGEKTELSAAFDIDLPMMVRPFVGPKLQKAADGFGDMFSKLLG